MTKRTLSALALSGLLLAGCSGGITDVERPELPASPSITATSSGFMVSGEPAETASVSASATPVPTAATAAPSSSVPEHSVPSEIPEPTTSPPAGTTPPPPPTAAPSSTPTSAPTGGAWVGMEVSITTAAGAEKLTATSPDFRAFVAERVSTPDASGCQSEFTVLAFHPDGYAAGQEFAPGCGGSQNIWGRVGGTWKTLMSMQSVVECTEMAANNIPKGLPDIPCVDAGGDLTDW